VYVCRTDIGTHALIMRDSCMTLVVCVVCVLCVVCVVCVECIACVECHTHALIMRDS